MSVAPRRPNRYWDLVAPGGPLWPFAARTAATRLAAICATVAVNPALLSAACPSLRPRRSPEPDRRTCHAPARASAAASAPCSRADVCRSAD